MDKTYTTIDETFSAALCAAGLGFGSKAESLLSNINPNMKEGRGSTQIYIDLALIYPEWMEVLLDMVEHHPEFKERFARTMEEGWKSSAEVGDFPWIFLQDQILAQKCFQLFPRIASYVVDELSAWHDLGYHEFSEHQDISLDYLPSFMYEQAIMNIQEVTPIMLIESALKAYQAHHQMEYRDLEPMVLQIYDRLEDSTLAEKMLSRFQKNVLALHIDDQASVSGSLKPRI